MRPHPERTRQAAIATSPILQKYGYLPSGPKGYSGGDNMFLQILTTQLKNQSPLDPLDTNQFTAQLVQFAGVEQQLRTNETLGSLLSLSAAGTATNAVGWPATPAGRLAFAAREHLKPVVKPLLKRVTNDG